MSESQQPSAQPYPPATPYGAPEYGTPQYGTPQYGAPQYGAPQQNPTPQTPPPHGGAPATGNRLGNAALLIAVVASGLGLFMQVIRPFLYSSDNFDIAQSLSIVSGILMLVGSIAAVVLSIIALRRPAPHLQAAIALGIAGTAVLAPVTSMLSGSLYSLF